MSHHFASFFTTDQLTVAAGGLTGVNGGPISVVVVFRLDDVSDDNLVVEAARADNGTVWSLNVFNGQPFVTMNGFQGGAPGLQVDTWYMYAWTKGAGTAQAREHLCVMATDTWLHANLGSPLADGTGPVDHIRFSSGSENRRFDGYVAAACVIASELNDAAVEALRPGLAAWVDAAALWRFGDTPVLDLTGGGADQTAISGTTVSVEDPPAFSYNIGDISSVSGGHTHLGLSLWAGAAKHVAARAVTTLGLHSVGVPEGPPLVAGPASVRVTSGRPTVRVSSPGVAVRVGSPGVAVRVSNPR